MIASKAGEIGARALANVVYGAARSGKGRSLGNLFTSLARAAERRVGNFNSHQLAITAWAFAKAGQSHASLFRVLTRVAEWHMVDFDA